jgi:hypothetical protein
MWGRCKKKGSRAIPYLFNYRFGKRLPHSDVSSRRRRPRTEVVAAGDDNAVVAEGHINVGKAYSARVCRTRSKRARNFASRSAEGAKGHDKGGSRGPAEIFLDGG